MTTAIKLRDPQVGYIIEIPDKYSIIINIGEEQGVYEDSVFAVYEEGPIIKDSQTGQQLGRKDFIKAVIIPSEIYPNFSVCRKKNQKHNSITSIGELLATDSSKILPVEEEQVKEWKPKYTKIKINDPIKNY
ncbi:hypothetical protein ACF3NL_04970 [Dolosigranulum pigrum]|jgi:hypothetical protein|uniref:hypothetical protein n=1 Tax=Dolosigranulum pigrum TaxID=29394 RepID=UPI001AD85A2B|nr:hypothetical protein [Dolosigranulum pigrum]QTJ38686.1 hypothetical protein FE324_07945 [Dolosigranulum pigrum]